MSDFADFLSFAAAAGAMLVLSALFALLFTGKTRRRKKILRKPFPPEWREELERRVPWFRNLTPPDRDRFERGVLVFLGEKKITGIETDVDDSVRLLVAASALIPVFGYPDWEYRMVSEILIYPSRFDNDFSFVKRRTANLGMTVSDTSTVILSKDALFEGYRNRSDMVNTGIHEFLHRVDAEDGALDGVPRLLLDGETYGLWPRIVDRELRLIERRRSDMDPYAAEDETEFFPVAGEYFFESPRKMARLHPELYALLCRMFRQDPLEKNEAPRT